MLKRTEGIVLKSSAFGEADLIVSYLTPDYGPLKAFAKSPRKVKSRFGSSLEPLTHARISLFGREESNLPRLTQSDIIRPFHALREDFKCLLDISELLELNLAFLPEKEPTPELFSLLLSVLVKLEADRGNRLYPLYYKMRFLEITGYSPKLDACGRCGSRTETEHHDFYVSHGSIICPGCIDERDESIRLSSGALKFYRSLLKWNPASIDRIKPPGHLMAEIAGVINSHVKYTLGAPRYPFKKYAVSRKQ
ncbi:MAG TPA: DNA repair protein RecO [Dissulfurispiraceae bacterium]